MNSIAANMNQTEIYQNMTKAPWTRMGYDHNEIYPVIDKDTVGENIAITHSGWVDADAIIVAVNNTYGKGINPESVEPIIKILSRIVMIEEAKHEGKGEPLPEWVVKAKDALTAAKL